MNKTLRVGLILLVIGIALRVFSELFWPVARAIPLGSAAQLPALSLLMVCIIASPFLILGGIITALVGAVKGNKAS